MVDEARAMDAGIHDTVGGYSGGAGLMTSAQHNSSFTRPACGGNDSVRENRAQPFVLC